jgi:hypothetical protein
MIGTASQFFAAQGKKWKQLEAKVGIEPAYTALQAAA